jgi:hypothetical protein
MKVRTEKKQFARFRKQAVRQAKRRLGHHERAWQVANWPRVLLIHQAAPCTNGVYMCDPRTGELERPPNVARRIRPIERVERVVEGDWVAPVVLREGDE